MKIVRETFGGRFGEAFAVGNGHLGAMIYGGTDTDRIDLSENTFFSGNPSIEEDNQPGAANAFYQMRELISVGDYEGALLESKEFYGRRNNYGTNLPVGSIYVRIDGAQEEISNYQRSLDLETGIVSASWNAADKKIQSNAFASHGKNVLCYCVEMDRKELNLLISFESPREGEDVTYHTKGLSFVCRALESLHSDGTTGVLLCGEASIQTDGCMRHTEQGVEVKEASFMRLYLAMETDFDEEVSEDLEGVQRIRKKAICHLEEALKATCLRMEHEEDMRSLFQRSTLELEGDEEYVELIPLMYQMGRYLLYSSSRSDSRLPAHLQGIWNDNVACRIGWTCDMHLDINTQMNYWPAEVTNISEVTGSLFSWIKDRLAPAGRVTAQTSYGLPGWVGELVANGWGYAAPYWASPLSPCPTGGVWILTHMWEHYQFTGDKEFLRQEAMPLIEEAVRFFLAYVYEDEKTGHYTCGPSISPENSFLVNGKSYQISAGCTYEILMIRELLDIFHQACDVLDCENQLLEQAVEVRSKLLPYRILEDGSIAEYDHDYPVADSQHRHTSHLLGLYPFAQITPEDERLAMAAETTIAQKLTPEENWEDTGWARSMLMLYEARLRNPNKAWYHITRMLEHLLEPNGFIIHPPTRGAGAFDNVYELDGNTGLTSCIAEMLIQSHNGVIRILPCLPKQWKKGKVKGLRARGGITVDIQWGEGISQVWLTADETERCVLKLGSHEEQLLLKAGETRYISI